MWVLSEYNRSSESFTHVTSSYANLLFKFKKSFTFEAWNAVTISIEGHLSTGLVSYDITLRLLTYRTPVAHI